MPVTCGVDFIGTVAIRYIIRNTRDAVINLESLARVSNSLRYDFEQQVDICILAECGSTVTSVN